MIGNKVNFKYCWFFCLLLAVTFRLVAFKVLMEPLPAQHDEQRYFDYVKNTKILEGKDQYSFWSSTESLKHGSIEYLVLYRAATRFLSESFELNDARLGNLLLSLFSIVTLSYCSYLIGGFSLASLVTLLWGLSPWQTIAATSLMANILPQVFISLLMIFYVSLVDLKSFGERSQTIFFCGLFLAITFFGNPNTWLYLFLYSVFLSLIFLQNFRLFHVLSFFSSFLLGISSVFFVAVYWIDRTDHPYGNGIGVLWRILQEAKVEARTYYRGHPGFEYFLLYFKRENPLVLVGLITSFLKSFPLKVFLSTSVIVYFIYWGWVAQFEMNGRNLLAIQPSLYLMAGAGLVTWFEKFPKISIAVLFVISTLYLNFGDFISMMT